jgi:uncharacterized delta-60 repeat protein
VNAAPTIEFQPQNRQAILNQSAAFGVIARNPTPLSYQWLKNGVPIPGAANDQFVLPAAQFSDAGAYSVAISSAEGSVTSAEARLTVRPGRGGDLDYSFASGGSINGAVRSALVQPDGKVLIAGEFTTAHGAARGGIARLNADGSTDHTFMNGQAGVALRGIADSTPTVSAMALQADGKILIGGNFTAVNGAGRTNIARLNADGSLDTGFQDGLSGADSYIYSIAVQNDGRLLVGGFFSLLNGARRGGIARLNPDGTLDTTFQEGMSGAQGVVYSIGLQADGKVVIGGGFSAVNDVALSNIARFNADGTLDTTFSATVAEPGAVVSSLAVLGDGRIVIGGFFGVVNGVNQNGVARLNADGTLDMTFQDRPIGPEREGVLSLALQGDGAILIAGTFTTVAGVSRPYVARLTADGRLDESFRSQAPGINRPVYSVATQSDGKALIGGSFTSVDGVSHHYVARLNFDGALDASLRNGISGADGAVSSLALQTDGKILIGGRFSQVHDVSRNGVARLNADGTVDVGFQSSVAGSLVSINSIALQNDGRVLIGGVFATINSQSRLNIARLNSDGTLDSGFQNGLSGANGAVYSVAAQTDGKVLIGGLFTSVNGEGRSNVARLNADGTLDSAFLNGLAGTDGGVAAVAVQLDGKVVLGGLFSTVNGESRNRIARLNADGTLDTTFLNELAGADGGVAAVLVQPDGKVLIGGSFTRVNGVIRNRVARLNPEGTLDMTFLNSSYRPDDTVTSLALQTNGKVVVGGLFTLTAGRISRNGVALLRPDGTLDGSFQNEAGGVGGPSDSSGAVHAVAIQEDANVLAGGRFTTVNGVPASGFARLQGSPDVPPRIMTVVRAPLGINLVWESLPNRIYRVQYKDDLGAAAWTDLAGNVTAVNVTATKTDNTFRNANQRVYRVVLLP